nr:MAG TPA: hypothetical protein [Caudoviricetes sp.]
MKNVLTAGKTAPRHDQQTTQQRATRCSHHTKSISTVWRKAKRPCQKQNLTQLSSNTRGAA